MACGHEDGGGLAPDLHLVAAAQGIVGLQRRLGHQQAGRAAGEGQGLGVVGDGQQAGGAARLQPFLQPDAVGFIVVVVGQQADGAVALLEVELLGIQVVLAHLEAQGQVAARQRLGLTGGQQLMTQSLTARTGVDGQRVEAGQVGAMVKQHQGVTLHHPLLLDDQGATVVALDEAAELAYRQAVAGKTARFQCDERIQILEYRGTDHD